MPVAPVVSFDAFRAAVLDLIALRRERLDALPLPDPDLQAELEDLEAEYLALVDKTTDADKAEIGEFYREALRVFGSNEEIFAQYPDVAGLLLTLRIEGARRRCCSSYGWPTRHRPGPGAGRHSVK